MNRAAGRAGDPGLRLRLGALAAVLLTLWAYAAVLTARDAAGLVRIRALADTLGQPTDLLILTLQSERRLTAETLAGAGRTRDALAEARDRTDGAVAPVRAFTEGHDPRLLTAGAVRGRADELVRQLAGLATLRSEVDGGRLDRPGAVAAYDRLIDTAFAVYGPEWGGREDELSAETRAVVALARARELLAREDTLMSAALAGGGLGDDDRRRLVELVAIQRYARTSAVAALPPEGRDRHQRLVESPRFAGLLRIEDRLLRTAGADGTAGMGPQGWREAVDPALSGLRDLVTSTARGSVERAAPGAALVVTRTGVVVGLGLIAVLVVLVGWARAVRRRAGDDPASPPAATDELFLRLTRRNQALLHEQLTLLGAMERRERTAEETADLFRLDHLATRVRRNVEKLVILAGGVPARRWRRPVPLLDVVRGAVAEVPDYHRVLIAPHWPWTLAGSGVTDVVHLLAELIENGLACAPEHTTVRIAGEPGPQGCAVVILDDGPGLDTAALADANELLDRPPPGGPPTGRAGLHAAGLLAARCGARVSLRPGPRGGTAAVVLLPPGLVTPATPSGGGVPPAHPPASAVDGGGLPTRIRPPGAVPPAPTIPDTLATTLRNSGRGPV
ncbi:nitrate- and nitrite sensing domain-containing protein [Micromonospora chaiyaphumensis]|uniref:histidine kinase n=1 Tax=Micromonospora chaiyaphumensis TaxID=307119 RepID=A0A1C4VHD8_9ACTN|nr:nitrate- and nitrite sensing domain-containing protein [Micromonospora chaiyaphumensis]SCE83402.1 Nitrate and nitrite sensing [Micromonospora chaiyaphumensis]